MKSTKLERVCYLISEFTFIPVRLFKHDELIKLFYPLNVPYDPFVLYSKEILNLPEHINYYITKRYNYYSIIKCKEFKIIIGPTRMTEITKEEIRKLLKSVTQNTDFIENTLGFINSINKMSLDSLLKLSSLINLLLNNEYNETIFNNSNQKEIVMQQLLNEKIDYVESDNLIGEKYNYKYFNDETVLISTIASGNVDRILKYTQTIQISDKNVTESQIKQIKHRFVTQLTLISRVAIRKGIDQEIVGKAINKYLNKIIQTNDINKINQLFNDMILCFTYLIKEVNSNDSPLINKINSFINTNITKNITVNDIAEQLYISRPYISAYFKKQTGENLSNYIYKCKINYSKNLLDLSNRSLREISQFLGFSSTSHFSSTFKKYTNMTPNEYKQKRAVNSYGF